MDGLTRLESEGHPMRILVMQFLPEEIRLDRLHNDFCQAILPRRLVGMLINVAFVCPPTRPPMVTILIYARCCDEKRIV